MSKNYKYFLLIIILIFLSSCVKPLPQGNLNIKNIAMKLKSSAFVNNSNLPAKYTCDGQRINPPLLISDVPKEAKSLALIFEDPDAPSKTFIHWILWNIDPTTTEISENSIPTNAKQGTTSAGSTGYFSPCPPSGTHHYIFKLYALDIVLNLTPNAGKDNLEQAMQGHILDSVELISLYSRQ